MSWRQKEISPPLVNTDYDYIFGMYYFIKKNKVVVSKQTTSQKFLWIMVDWNKGDWFLS